MKQQKIIDKPKAFSEFDHDGKFCGVWYLINRNICKYIMDMKDTARTTLSHSHFHSSKTHSTFALLLQYKSKGWSSTALFLWEKSY